jgi:hypothetical protein
MDLVENGGEQVSLFVVLGLFYVGRRAGLFDNCTRILGLFYTYTRSLLLLYHCTRSLLYRAESRSLLSLY